MGKKYILVVLITLTVFIAFMVLRNSKKTKEGDEYAEGIRNQMMEMALKSRTGGLTHMGMIISGYHKKNKKYPGSIKELYPDYIDNKPFVYDIDWQYTPRNDDFILTKTTTINNVKMVASIDKTLVPRAGTDIMMASINDIDELITTRKEEETLPIPTDKDTKRRVTGIRRTKRVKIAPILRPEVVKVIDGEIGSGVSSEVSDLYLVWKDETGHLGFGNREYPVAQKLSTYKKGSWLHTKTRMPEKHDTSFKGSEGEKSKDKIASDIDGKYLIWKDKNGQLGFGDAAYPDEKRFFVYSPDKKWENVKKSAPLKEKKEETEATTPKTQQSTDELASDLEGQYLVWKDKNGNIGFGNVLYPKKSNLSIYNQKEWVDARKPAKAKHTPDTSMPATHVEKGPDQLASDLGGQYLVWKDKNGNIGFGNVLYPEKNNLFVYKQDKWVKAKKALPDGKKPESSEADISDETDTLEREKSPGKISRETSEQYLVWKDKNGNICYGNIQYPELNKISNVYVGGKWESTKKKQK